MQEEKSVTFLQGLYLSTAGHCLWVPNGPSVSPSKAWSEFDLVAEGILGPGRRCNKTNRILCAETCMLSRVYHKKVRILRDRCRILKDLGTHRAFGHACGQACGHACGLAKQSIGFLNGDVSALILPQPLAVRVCAVVLLVCTLAE